MISQVTDVYIFDILAVQQNLKERVEKFEYVLRLLNSLSGADTW
jgi:hypothetical protein